MQDEWRKAQVSQPIHLLKQEDAKGILIKTLIVFFAQNCDLAQTCAELHIHRNTLRYRLDKIEHITRLKINNIDEKTQLYLALKCM